VTQDIVMRATGAIRLAAGGDVTVRKIAGLPLSESEVVGSEITIHSGGVITIENEAVLESTYGRVTSAPPLLRIDELDPDKTIIPGDRVQELYGTVGGIEAEGDNLELGEDFIIVVVWDDGQTTVVDMSTLPGGVPLRAGDKLEVHVGEDASDYTVTVIPGDGTGPVEVLITREYPVSHLITVSLEVVATVKLSNDPDIVLTDSQGIDLNHVSDTVATSVAGEEFRIVGIPMEFHKPAAIATETKTIAVLEIRTPSPLSTTRLDEIRPPGETMVEQTRMLYLVKVGPDGVEGKREPLPSDALLNLTELFETFKIKRLPNGLYRIYLEELGFPIRKLIEFYKSGTSFGVPVQEPGKGSNPLDDESTSTGRPGVPDAEAPGVEDAAENLMQEDIDEARALPGSLRRCLAGTAVAAGGLLAGRWDKRMDEVMEGSGKESFTRAARLQRRFRRSTGA